MKNLLMRFLITLLLLVSILNIANAKPTLEPKDIHNQYVDTVVMIKSVTPGENVVGSGTGTLVSPKGHILTACHVIQKEKIYVMTYDQEIYEAVKVLKDTDSYSLDGVCVVKINSTKSFKYMKIANTAEVGERVVVIGYPLGLSWTMTEGIISRIISKEKTVQIDAAINPGNSGGPVINNKGELVSVVISLINPYQSFNIGLNISYVPDRIVKELKKLPDFK